MYNMCVLRVIVPLMIVNQCSSTNPGSVWFPEVSQTRRTSTEFQSARNSNFPVCLHCFTLQLINKEWDYWPFVILGLVPQDRKGTMTNIQFQY